MGKRAKLIYNPVSGKGSFGRSLDMVIEAFQRADWQLMPYRTAPDIPISTMLEDNLGFDAIIAAGGDGTVHHVINGMVAAGTPLPLGIVPVGTVNDFASYLGIPQGVKECCEIILKGKVKPLDVGAVNDRYFLNVVSGGLLTDVPHTTSVRLKNMLGRLAYYAKGLEVLPKFKPLQLSISADCGVWEENCYLFLVLNSTSAGGFKNLAPYAKVDDGLLDVLLIKDCPLSSLLPLLIKLLRGQHLADSNVINFQTTRLSIVSREKVKSDLDGEIGPGMPLNIKVLPKAVNVYVP